MGKQNNSNEPTDLYIEDYTNQKGEIRSFIVQGPTKKFEEELRLLGGKYTSLKDNKTGAKLSGYLFPMSLKPWVTLFVEENRLYSPPLINATKRILKEGGFFE